MAPTSTTLVYKTVDGIKIPLDVYLPTNAKKAPILLWFHGGGLLQGSCKYVTPHLLKGTEKHGYALISADYRLAPQVGVADVLEDVKDCISFIRNDLPKHVDPEAVDTGRLAVSGSSAGGYLSLLAGLYVEPKPRVILPIYPITDPAGLFFVTSQGWPVGPVDAGPLQPFLDPHGQVMTSSDNSSPRSKLYLHMMHEANLAKLLHLQPGDDTFRVAKMIHKQRLPPTYVVHGDADRFVGVDQADEVVGAMVGLGLEVKYERPHGLDHQFDENEDVEMADMYQFMMKHI